MDISVGEIWCISRGYVVYQSGICGVSVGDVVYKTGGCGVSVG
jgi:hypothetical protein